MDLCKFNNSEQFITDTYPAYQIDEATADTTYIRWEDTDEAQFIQKIVEADSVTTIGYAKGLWSGRAGLTYVSFFAFRDE